MSKLRLVLFIDGQNFYNGARRAFFTAPYGQATYGHIYGQFRPMELGKLICQRNKFDVQLTEVRVYTGRPEATKQPKTYAAHMKQCAVWEKEGVIVIYRALRYPPEWPDLKPVEKGIDVALAIDFVAFAIDRKYDVGVIASTDTDIIPALEYVYHKCSNSCRIEVTAWTSPNTSSRLSVKDCNVWCHWLKQPDYNMVADLTDYNA